MKHQDACFLAICLICCAVAFGYGDFIGRKVSRANNMLFNMALLAAATAEMDKIPPNAFPEQDLCRAIQAGFLSDAITKIEERGFPSVLKESNLSDDSFLLALYRESKAILNKGTCCDDNL